MTEDQIKDAIRFSNFCQKLKMLVWEKKELQEKDLDDIAEKLWEYQKLPVKINSDYHYEEPASTMTTAWTACEHNKDSYYFTVKFWIFYKRYLWCESCHNKIEVHGWKINF